MNEWELLMRDKKKCMGSCCTPRLKYQTEDIFDNGKDFP